MILVQIQKITIMSQLKNELAFNCNFTLPLQESMLWKPLSN